VSGVDLGRTRKWVPVIIGSGGVHLKRHRRWVSVKPVPSKATSTHQWSRPLYIGRFSGSVVSRRLTFSVRRPGWDGVPGCRVKRLGGFEDVVGRVSRVASGGNSGAVGRVSRKDILWKFQHGRSNRTKSIRLWLLEIRGSACSCRYSVQSQSQNPRQA